MQIGHDQDTPEQEIQEASSESDARHEGVIASSGVPFRLWRLYQHAWLVCLAFPLVELVQKPITPLGSHATACSCASRYRIPVPCRRKTGSETFCQRRNKNEISSDVV